jgi:methylase of polypeptide subunit release factors
MNLPPGLSNLEEKFLTKYVNSQDESGNEEEEKLTSLLGEVFLSLLVSNLVPISKIGELLNNYKGSRSGVAFIDLFLEIIKLSDILSVNDPIVIQMQQYLMSDVSIESLTVRPCSINSNLVDFSFKLEETSSSTHLYPHLLSVITEYYPLISKGKKKRGKYYTLPSDAALISLLVVFRFLRDKFTDLSDDMIFNFLLEDNKEIELKNQFNGKLQSNITILDPACGSGTFLIQLVLLLSKLATLNERVIRLSIDAVDLDPTALFVTRLRFFLLELHCVRQYGASGIQFDISIKREDFLFSNSNQEYDIIIGNPPFIRHEDIGFSHSPDYKKKLMAKVMKETNNEVIIDKKSDLYIYFCIKSLNMLKSTGILGFLTSNSWLEVNYGKTLQNYLIQLLSSREIAQCEIIYQSGTRLWKEIGINSIVFLVTRNLDSKSQSQGIFFSDSNTVLTQIPKNELKRSMLFCNETISSYYRTEFIPIPELLHTSKWAGSFLRASKEERRILRKIIGQGVPLHTIADVRFGIKTGANEFFHLTGLRENRKQKTEIQNKRNYTGYIENEFLVPLVKSPSEIDSYLVTHNTAKKDWLFYCHKSKDQLKGTSALKYIQWGEKVSIPVKQGRKMGTNVQGYSSLASIGEKELWYSINPYRIPSLLWAKSYHNKPGCFLNPENLFPDQRFYSIYHKNKSSIPLIFTYLNSSLVWALMEKAGNTNMGLGVLDTNVYWLKSLSIPEALSPKQLEEIKVLADELKKVSQRESITSESDNIRTKINKLYTNVLGLTDSEFKIITNFIEKSIKRRLRGNQTHTIILPKVVTKNN